MRGNKQPGFARATKHVAKLARWVAGFGQIEADTDDLVAKRQGLVEGLFGVRLVEVAKKAHDQAFCTPNSRSASVMARWRPLITVENAIPRAVCPCGSKNISTCRTLSPCARFRYAQARS